jgi:sigma-B regulation protein RsbU (phosphoserine phosphatase)
MFFITEPRSSPAHAKPQLRWYSALPFRLALILSVVVICVLGTFDAVSARYEWKELLQTEISRLREEARVLRVTRLHISATEGFQQFVDDFCRQMSSTASPGHHIVLFDAAGDALIRAHERADPGLEAKMAANRHQEVARFVHRGARYVSVATESSGNETVTVAQSLAPIERIVRARSASRIVSIGVLASLIVGLTTIGLLVWVRNPLRHLVAGVAAIGDRQFDYRVRPSGSPELRYLAGGVNEMAKSLEAVERCRQAEMERAREIQQRLLPDNQFPAEHLEIAGVSLPADSVGGDLYDVIGLKDGSILLAVLDVSGHGVPAALYTALLRTILRHHADAVVDVSHIARAMNDELSIITGAGEFATCFLARIRGDSGEVDYVNAGHDPPVILRANGAVNLLAGAGLPLGVKAGTRYETLKSTLGPADRLLIFTDGLHEVFDARGRLMGRQRLARLLSKTSWVPIEVQLGLVIQQVRSLQGNDEFADDVTLVAVRRR